MAQDAKGFGWTEFSIGMLAGFCSMLLIGAIALGVESDNHVQKFRIPESKLVTEQSCTMLEPGYSECDSRKVIVPPAGGCIVYDQAVLRTMADGDVELVWVGKGCN